MRRMMMLVLSLFPFTACETPADPAVADAHAEHAAVAAARSKGPEVQKWLAQLRSELAPFHRFEAAEAALYGTEITPCMEKPGVGGMGYHFGNPVLIDGLVEPLAPELLLYEPQKNGRYRLVAVEYVVPFGLWTSPEPPAIHGIPFHENFDFGLWVLHAWIWQHNPDGMFEDWNPRVSCRYAPPA